MRVNFDLNLCFIREEIEHFEEKSFSFHFDELRTEINFDFDRGEVETIFAVKYMI